MAGGNTIKTALKRSVRTVAHAAGAGRTPRPAVRILTYHSIGHRTHEMNVTPAAFAEHMAWLAEHLPVIPLAEAATHDPAVNGSAVVLTFDDGYADNLHEAAPVLAKHSFAATVFMVAGCAGGHIAAGGTGAADRLMSWEELATWRAAGHTVGAHTMTHARLSTLPEAAQTAEIRGSVALIAERLGEPVNTFAYPFGSARDYDATTMQLVRAAGCTIAVSNRYGYLDASADAWEWRRIWIDATDTRASFAAKATGRLDALRVLDSPAAIAGRRLLNRALRA